MFFSCNEDDLLIFILKRPYDIKIADLQLENQQWNSCAENFEIECISSFSQENIEIKASFFLRMYLVVFTIEFL